MLNLRKLIGFWFLALPNLALFYVGLWLALQWRYPLGLEQERMLQHLGNFSIIYIFWLLVFLGFHLFELETFRRYTTLFFSLASATVTNLLVAIGYFYFQPELILTPRRFLLVNLLLVFILVLVWDLAMKAFVISRFTQLVYLFSFNKELEYLEQEIEKHSYLGFRVRGHISEEELQNLPAKPGAVVIFPDDLHANPQLAHVIFNLRNRGIKFYDHNSFYEQLLRRVYLPSLNQIWFLQNVSYTKKIFYNILKFFSDLTIGLIIFLMFLITFPVIAVLIKATSSGPVLFRQARVGKDGKIFNIYKYRTMIESLPENRWTEPDDQRITVVGTFLRKTRIDEMPQSINLLLRNMSLVGPRPEQVGIVENLKQKIPFYDERHIVMPGITGWAQLNVYAGSLEESRLKLEYDLFYIKHQSIFFDLEIILKTVYNILKFKGR